MTWISLLLAERSPLLRIRVLRELLGRPDTDMEIKELQSFQEEDPIISGLLNLQRADGSWKQLDFAGSTHGNDVQLTARALIRLGYVGLSPAHKAVKQAVEFLFKKQRKDGSWPIPKKWKESAEIRSAFTMVPLQTSVPLAGIAIAGYAKDERAELAYDWLLNQRLEDGAWPTGLAGKVYGYVGGYRRIAHSRWGCRTNTTAALISLAHHPQRRMCREAQRALDLLMGRETRERQNLGFNVTRIIGLEPHRGNLTYYAKFDPALLLDLCWRVGADSSDARVSDLIDWIREQQGQSGLWEYLQRPEATRWVTFDLLRSLDKLDKSGNWISTEPRTPFTPYPKKQKRF